MAKKMKEKVEVKVAMDKMPKMKEARAKVKMVKGKKGAMKGKC